MARGAATIQAGWEYVKEVKDLDSQLGRIADRHLETSYCSDTVTVDALLAAVDLPYDLRDLVRFRHQARPEMVAFLVRAIGNLRATDPGVTIAIGDVAQAGCGQIHWGTIVTFEDAADTEAILARSPVAFGLPTEVIGAVPEDFLDEYPRFDDTYGPVWVERIVTGITDDGRARVETRRFDTGQRLGPGSIDGLIDRTTKRFKGKDVVWDTVPHTSESGTVTQVRRGRWHDDKDGRWAELIVRPTRSLWPLRAEKILRVREAGIDAGKPTSLKFEERYDVDYDGEAGVVVTRLLLEYEAHHASHIGGLDVDLSYVTHGNAAHFMPSVALMDLRRSWRWMKALHKAAEDLGIPLTALFVDKSVIRALRTVSEARKDDPTWRKIHAAPGHDSHVHVRLGAAPRFASKSLAQLIALGLGKAR